MSPVSSVCHLVSSIGSPRQSRECQKTVTRFQPRVLGLSDGSKRPYKKPHTRASVSHRATTSQHPESNQETEGSPHRARTTRASLARGNRLDGRICRRAPPGGRRRPPRVPRARRSRRRTSAHPPLAEFGESRVAWRSPAWRSRAPGSRGSPRPTLTEATRYTRPSTPPSPRVRAAVERHLPGAPARSSPPKNAPPRNHHQKTANQDETSVSPRPRPARSHRLGHRHVLAVPPAPERHLPHHPVRGARRREGDPGAG